MANARTRSRGNSTPDTVYQAGVGGGAMILDKYPRAVGHPPQKQDQKQ